MDMKRITILLAAAFALGAVSCSGERETGGGVPDGDTVWFSPEVTVGTEASAMSRTVVNDNSHFPMSSFTLWLESDTPDFQQDYYTLGYDNIMGSSSYGNSTLPSSRNYILRGAEDRTQIGLMKSKNAVTFFGMHPYLENFDPTATTTLPFTVGTTNATNYDYMYTGPVTVDPNLSPSPITTPMSFKHVMTLIEFRMTTTYAGTLILNTAKLTATNGGSPQPVFLMNGTWNPRTGGVNPDAASASAELEITYNSTVKHESTSDPGYTSVGFIVPEIPHTDGNGTKFKAVFKFQYRDQNNTSWTDYEELTGQPSEIEFDLDDILTGGNAQGFCTGYRYIFNISVDNFIKYLGYPVVEPWSVPDENDPDDPNTEDIIF